MKKIVTLCLAIFIFAPYLKTSAAPGGYFEENPTYRNMSALFAGTHIYGKGTFVYFDADKNGISPIDITHTYQIADTTVNWAFYDSAGKLIAGNKSFYSLSVVQSQWVSNEFSGVSKIVITNPYSSARPFTDFDFIVVDGHLPIVNLKETHDYRGINISWENPESEKFKSISIMLNGVVVGEFGRNVQTYAFDGLKPETKYDIDIIANYDDGITKKESISVLTDAAPPPPPEVVEEVEDLTAKAFHNRVDLAWILPSSDNFKHVNIYRETLQKSFLDNLLGINTVMAATPIFETNGTYFNDLTVKSETKYEYTLTTLSKEKVESEGVSITVTTLENPTPVIDGGGWEEDPVTGDYTYYWTEPTTGKVKVMVGGKLYATVPAVNGEIVIPSVEMKFNIFGKPDVKLIPVDEEGSEGKPVNPPPGSGGGPGGGIGGDGELPFTVLELIKATFDFIKLVGPYLLIGLAIYLTPQIIEVIRMAILRRSIGGEGNDE